MYEVIWNAETTANRRRLYGKLVDSTDAVSGKNITTTGVKAKLTKADGTAFTSTADIVLTNSANAPGRFYVELTAGEANTIGVIDGEVPASVPGGYLAATLHGEIVAFDPYADGASVSTIASGVRTELGTELGRMDASVSSRASAATLAAGVTLTAGERASSTAAMLATIIETNGGVTMTIMQALLYAAAGAVGKRGGIAAGIGTQTITLRSATDKQVIATITGDDLGNTTTVVLTPP